MRKIATCCYCGQRTALVLRGEGRHELSCAACGAPLHEMKAIPCASQTRAAKRPGPKPKPQPKPAPHPYDTDHDAPRGYRPNRRCKRRKPFLRDALEEIWDVVEDIFD